MIWDSRSVCNVSFRAFLHNTTVDEHDGQVRRLGFNTAEMAAQPGDHAFELQIGLWPAVVLFLEMHPEWRVKERFTNNNGLTVLERVA
jgi:hypothetical protein